MLDNKIRNQQIRERFAKFLEDNYNPQLKILAKAIGINYQNFASWSVGSLDYGKKSLDKVEEFLDRKEK